MTRRFGLCLWVTALVFVSFTYWQATKVIDRQELDASLADVSYGNDLRACHRANETRRTWNRAIPTLKKDVRNLALLSAALTRTRVAEAKAFREIGEAFGIQREVAPLVEALERAARIDRKIQRTQSALKLRRFAQPNCVLVVERDT